jgi:hypothetical protein
VTDIANDEEIAKAKLCADIVSEKRFEPALLGLLCDTQAGEWRSLAELSGDNGDLRSMP